MPDEKKYAKYIIEKTAELSSNPLPGAPMPAGGTNVLLINDELQGTVPNATYMNAEIIAKPTEVGPFQQHVHAFDEYVTFIGTNIEKPYDLDGVVEFWIEDEKYVLTKSCAVFVPKGIYHSPCVFHEVNSPIVWVESSAATNYSYGMM
jgi:mannose-6-phosphate isomerase-like protein (cupin superfamily)